MDRQKYIDDYGLQIDPLFDKVDELEQKLAELRYVARYEDYEKLKQEMAKLQEAAKEACIEMGCFCDDEDVGSDVCVMCRLEQTLRGGENPTAKEFGGSDMEGLLNQREEGSE